MKASLLRIARGPAGGWVVRLAIGPLRKILPIEALAESDTLITFRHPQPSWETHILLVPKSDLSSLADLGNDQGDLLSEVFATAERLAQHLQLNGYRVIVNAGAYQEVGQLHFHLVSGPTQAG